MPISLFNPQPGLASVLPLHILSNGQFSRLPGIAAYLRPGGRAAAAWPANNLAVYFPVTLSAVFTVSQFFVGNGATTTGNVDIGLYDTNGKLLISTGSTSRAASGSVLQYISVTPQAFPAGFYYIAMVCGSSSGTFDQIPLTNALYSQAAGFLQESLGSVALPATMTPVQYTGTSAWNFGFSQSATL